MGERANRKKRFNLGWASFLLNAKATGGLVKPLGQNNVVTFVL